MGDNFCGFFFFFLFFLFVEEPFFFVIFLFSKINQHFLPLGVMCRGATFCFSGRFRSRVFYEGFSIYLINMGGQGVALGAARMC